jgi:uncharacterized membrane protein YbhN (UPF0104 family)
MNNASYTKKESRLNISKRVLRIILPIISACLFALAFWVLYHELKNYHYREVVHYFHELPLYRLFLALFSSILSYLMLIGYDFLGMWYIRHPLGYGKIAFASYIGYAFSNSIGYSFLSGGFVRYRLYSAWGLSAAEIAKVVAFCIFSSFLGFFTFAGISFLIKPETIPSYLHLPLYSVRPVGIFFIALVAIYFSMIFFFKKPLSIRGRQLRLPSKKLFPAQILVSTLDWAFATFTLYFLLPPNIKISLPGFISIFMTAQFAGLVSHVPGGLGIFEVVMLLLLPPVLTHSQIIGSLVSFRIIYYFIPLTIAAVMLGARELLQLKKKTVL